MANQEIYDPLRGKSVARTPEEEVRQAFVRHMIEHMGYPRTLMANEVALLLNDRHFRADTVIYGSDLRILGVVEYKAPDVEIDNTVMSQILRYNMAMRARILIATNGRKTVCCKATREGTFERFMDHIPTYFDLTNMK